MQESKQLYKVHSKTEKVSNTRSGLKNNINCGLILIDAKHGTANVPPLTPNGGSNLRKSVDGITTSNHLTGGSA